MYCYRHHATPAKSLNRITCRGSLCQPRPCGPLLMVWVSLAVGMAGNTHLASAETPLRTGDPAVAPQDQAKLLVQRTIQRLALGDAFDAKLRQRIWAGGREVVGIGHYEQSGGGTGRFSLEMTIHDGDSRQSIRQISDGKLAWIRTQLGDSVSLRRVDLGRIDEVYREAMRPAANQSPRSDGYASTLAVEEPAPPWMRVGGLVELVDTIASDFDLRIGKGKVDEQPVWILRGILSEDARERVHEAGERDSSPSLCPFEVRLAIAAVGDASGFGVGLPVRMEFWSKPVAQPSETADGEAETAQEPPQIPTSGHSDAPRGRLISLLEIYAIRRIEPSPEERFRFKRDDPDVTFSNDTRRYLDRLLP